MTVTNGTTVDPGTLFHRFFPAHAATPDRDPFDFIQRILTGIAANRGQISLYAIPAFVWFSTRLFGGVRTALNELYDVSARPPPPRHFLLTLVSAKLRDIAMVAATVILFLANTLLTAGLALVQDRGEEQVIEQFRFFVSTLGRLSGELLAFAFSVSLFYVTYRYASLRKLPWRAALLGSTFTALMFEVAKRLYGLYLARFASLEGPAGDANIGAAVLFVLWIYYTAIVFLLGAVVAETWELRRMLRKQRATLG